MGRVLILVASVIPGIACAQGYWAEHFDHNNPGLYTNLNGGPPNLSIQGGVAEFDGSLGTYYGRPDLTPDTLIAVGMTARLTPSPNGVIGVGWHHPTFGIISAAYDHDTSLVMLVQHDAFGFNILASASTSGIVVQRMGLYPGWQVWADGPGGFAQASAQSTVTLDWSSHFMMYGAEGPGGPGQIDWVVAGSLPEPGTWAALIVGLGLLAFRRFRRG